MAQRVGILRVTNDGTMIRAEAGGQLTPQEWIFAIELTKARILEQAGKASPVELVPRKIDKLGGGG
jgi:hypothetical protein